MHFMTFSKSEIILVTKFMGSACLRGLHILFLGVFPRPISSDNSVEYLLGMSEITSMFDRRLLFPPLDGGRNVNVCRCMH